LEFNALSIEEVKSKNRMYLRASLVRLPPHRKSIYISNRNFLEMKGLPSGGILCNWISENSANEFYFIIKSPQYGAVPDLAFPRELSQPPPTPRAPSSSITTTTSTTTTSTTSTSTTSTTTTTKALSSSTSTSSPRQPVDNHYGEPKYENSNENSYSSIETNHKPSFVPPIVAVVLFVMAVVLFSTSGYFWSTSTNSGTNGGTTGTTSTTGTTTSGDTSPQSSTPSFPVFGISIGVILLLVAVGLGIWSFIQCRNQDNITRV